MAMNKHATTKSGVEAVVDVVNAYAVQATADGLQFASPADLSAFKVDSITLPERLEAFLTDIRLLRRIPISYLVPDPDLLPPESIRFFHVNQTWVDRVIDGVFSNTNVGTVDFHYSLTTLQMIREKVNPAPNGMTGILIRSELVRRWPGLIVRAFSSVNAGVDAESTVPVLRHEPISRDLYIALFAGQPRRIHIREPFEGVRFGVEGTPGSYNVDQRNPDGSAVTEAGPNGTQVGKNEPVPLRSQPFRTLNVNALRTQLAARSQGDARGVGLHLEQRPFVQVFRDTVAETNGSVPPPIDYLAPLRHGKLFTLTAMPQALFTLED